MKLIKTFHMVNNHQLQRILKKLKEIEDKLEKPKSFDDYVSELEAKKLLVRGTTWFLKHP
ncbi:hypothetical protein OAZ27_03090 [Bacteroidia bacterium]|nr:hypothetical protein [Bacteroidia bacterium]